MKGKSQKESGYKSCQIAKRMKWHVTPEFGESLRYWARSVNIEAKM
jgi:hypothetical protein